MRAGRTPAGATPVRGLFRAEISSDLRGGDGGEEATKWYAKRARRADVERWLAETREGRERRGREGKKQGAGVSALPADDDTKEREQGRGQEELSEEEETRGRGASARLSSDLSKLVPYCFRRFCFGTESAG